MDMSDLVKSSSILGNVINFKVILNDFTQHYNREPLFVVLKDGVMASRAEVTLCLCVVIRAVMFL